MRLIENLEDIAQNHESLFRRQLAKEDLARIEKLALLVKTSDDLAAFLKEGLYIGWTQNDMRTHELADRINPLLGAFYDIWTSGISEQETQIAPLWAAFERERLQKLVHCL